MLLIGYDLGSSSVKAALWDAHSGKALAVVQSPELEMSIAAPHSGWAEQDPECWWQHVCLATQKLLKVTGASAADIRSIGISYQMHGLVLVDKSQRVLRPAIIWCDSRAVSYGEAAFNNLGADYCLENLLNSPGNFTAAKLAWVKENEPDIYRQAHHFMLPGDYLAMRLSGEIQTTPGGLSEGILWDYRQECIATSVLDHWEIDPQLVPPIVPNIAPQSQLSSSAAAATGLCQGTPITYRAGDQPNNALALNVLHPGEIAATGGTSGVVYGVVDQAVYDKQSRVNSFLHANHSSTMPRIGVLLCINGAGSLYSWMRSNMTGGQCPYATMNELAGKAPVGASGLKIWPFGNGAERMLRNQVPGAQLSQWHFNRHTSAHLYRAALEGIAFSFVYGVEIMQQMGLEVEVMRVGNDNLFRSAIFSQTIANLLQCQIEVIETTGAVGAAKAAGVAGQVYASLEDAMQQTTRLRTYAPAQEVDQYTHAYQSWSRGLEALTTSSSVRSTLSKTNG